MNNRFNYLLGIIFSVLILSSCATKPPTIEGDNQSALLLKSFPFLIKNAQAPRLSAISNGLLLSWLDDSNNIKKLKFSLFKNNQWSQPQTAQEGNNWFINYADYAKVTALDDAHFIASWLEFSDSEEYDYQFKVSQSFDAGISWSKKSSPILRESDGEHGFLSLLKINKLVSFVWISSLKKHYAVQSATLNQHNQWSQISTIDEDTCSCCHTDVARLNKQVIVAYRNRSSNNIRDIAVAKKTEQHWNTPSIVHADDWEINGCPVNGPSIITNAKGYYVLWFTAANDKPRVKLKYVSNDQPLAKHQILDDQQPIGYVDSISLKNNQSLMMWLSYKDHLKVNFYQPKNEWGESKTSVKPNFVINLDEPHIGFPSIASYLNKIYLTYATVKGELVLLSFDQNNLR